VKWIDIYVGVIMYISMDNGTDILFFVNLLDIFNDSGGFILVGKKLTFYK